MITAPQIKEKLKAEKDPLKYLDEQIDLCLEELGDSCLNIHDTISAYRQRADKEEQFERNDITDDLKHLGELYFDVIQYQKVRKEEVKRQKQQEQVKKAQVKHQKWMEEKGKKASELK